MARAIVGYTILAYPESMPDDWQMKLEKLPFGYCYALHDKDTRVDDDGVIVQKKAHMHFFFLGTVSSKQKNYISASLGVNILGQPVRRASDMYDYLTHENAPDKYHYPKEIIVHSSKWSQEEFETIASRDPDTADHTKEIIQIIRQGDFVEYSDYMDYLDENGCEQLQTASKALWVMRYIDSRRNAMYKREKRI